MERSQNRILNGVRMENTFRLRPAAREVVHKYGCWTEGVVRPLNLLISRAIFPTMNGVLIQKNCFDYKRSLDTGKNKAPKPYVINRYRFKQDVSGYLYDTRFSHLYLFDVATKKVDTLTHGIYNETSPQWSPDGSKIAFVSNQTEDPDKNSNSDIWIIEPRPGAVAKQFTTWKGSDGRRNGVLTEQALLICVLHPTPITSCTINKCLLYKIAEWRCQIIIDIT